MGDGDSVWRKFVVGLEVKIFARLRRRIDKFVLLTEAMADRLGLAPEDYIVVEGMIDAGQMETRQHAETRRTFVYTGALDERYGILDLVEAFKALEPTDIRLIVCGSGNAEGLVRSAARDDGRIEFLGRLSQAESRAIQMRAHVLVNPRRPEGEFTKYSFPSKTLEYMSTGRPVVMHCLPGMPAEYHPFVIVPASPDMMGLAGSLHRTLSLSDESLDQIGKAGRDFVMQHKTAEKQCERIVKFIEVTRAR
jgi:glycosyltransferase involved in cell wall biosynthesis